ncbi:MAG: hypothetical protein ACOC56_01475 [Atribacterota bacterium]
MDHKEALEEVIDLIKERRSMKARKVLKDFKSQIDEKIKEKDNKIKELEKEVKKYKNKFVELKQNDN